jgi:iron complex outermembrane receptor protein
MSVRSRAITSVVVAGGAMGALAFSSAFAADAASGTDTSSASLEEIVVTAEKFNVDVLHAAESVTAINGDELTQLRVNSWSDLQFVVPGLSVQTTGGGTTFNIRGVGAAFNNPNIAQGVPVYRDGMLLPLGIGDEPLWDIGNVQVLRGPQGTLTGANSVGGAIFINEVTPTINDTSGYMQALGGNYHHLQVQGAASLPINDVLAARVGAYVERRDSFSNNMTPGSFNMGAGVPTLSNREDPGSMNQYMLRGSLLFQPSDKFSVLARVDYETNVNGGLPQKPFVYTSTVVNGVTTICPAAGSYFNTSPTTWSQVPNTCGYAAFAPATPYDLAYAGNDSIARESFWREHIEGKYEFGDHGPTLKFLAGAQYNTTKNQSENNASEYYNGGSINGSYEHTLTYEADLISAPDEPLQWVVGGFWWRDYNNFLFTNPGASGGALCDNITAGSGCSIPNGSGIYLSGVNSKTSYAAFANLQYAINEQWKVEGGVRETWDVGSNPTIHCPAGMDPNGPQCQTGPSGTNLNSFHFYYIPNPADPWDIALKDGAGSGFSNWGEYGDHLFTWKLALDYNLTAHDFLYGQVATGAKAGGIQNQGDTPDCHGGALPAGVNAACFQPEKDTNFEVGYKASFLDNHATFQADAFYIKYNNMQVNSRDPLTGQGNIHNAGSATDHGFEVSATANASGWIASGSVSYTKSNFSIGNIVDDEICGLVNTCHNANNIGLCAPGQPNGGANLLGTSPTGCFNYQGGVTINGQFLPFITSVSGLQLPFSPTWQGNLSVAYDIGLDNGDRLTPRADFMYQGSQYSAIFDTPADQLQSRTNLNASLTWGHGRWAVEGYVTNLTNQVYPIAGGNTVTYNAPRQVGVQVFWNSK